MKHILRVLIALLMATSAAWGGSGEKLQFKNAKRTVYFHVPPTLAPDKPAPLLILLHGSGRNGQIMVDNWKSLADKEGIVLAAPDSANPNAWNIKVDTPEFFQAVVDAAATKAKIDARRVYLFGHSAGAVLTLYLALLESEYFAAGAIHAGALRPGGGSDILISFATRKIPIYLAVGDRDPFFPLSAVRATREALQKSQIPATLDEIKNHDHNYYAIAQDVNRKAWEFLRDKSLSDKPQFVSYGDAQ